VGQGQQLALVPSSAARQVRAPHWTLGDGDGDDGGGGGNARAAYAKQFSSLHSNATCSLTASNKIDCNPGNVGAELACEKKGAHARTQHTISPTPRPFIPE
jgi:hypothetical protein